MANMLSMLKDAASMKKRMKQMQKDLEKKTVEISRDGITVSARGDMSIAAISIDAAAVDPADLKSLERKILTVCNKALDGAKKEAGAEMAKMTGGLGGLSDLLGG